MRIRSAFVLLLGLGCLSCHEGCLGGLHGPKDDIWIRTAEVRGDSLIIRFDVDLPFDWYWTLELDTDMASDSTGKKTGVGSFGAEFTVDGRERSGDSVAVRPWTGPADASGRPAAVGWGKLDPGSTVSLTIRLGTLSDDGNMAYQVTIVGVRSGADQRWVDGVIRAPSSPEIRSSLSGARSSAGRSKMDSSRHAR